MNRQRSGFGLYAAFMVIIVLAMFYITGKISAGSSPSQQKFETAVKDGRADCPEQRSADRLRRGTGAGR